MRSGYTRGRERSIVFDPELEKKNGKSIDEIDPFCAIWMTRNVIVIIR